MELVNLKKWIAPFWIRLVPIAAQMVCAHRIHLNVYSQMVVGLLLHSDVNKMDSAW